MLSETLLFMAIGRLAVWFLQTAGLLRKFWSLHSLLRELQECDLCLGVWVYAILAAIFRLNVLAEVGYVPVLSEALTGGAASFVMHLLRLGWNARFGVTVIEE